jgi:hypothetical protein
VRTTNDQTVATGHSVGVDPARWQAGLEELLGRVAGRFGRVEPRRRARALVLGLLADLPRKNCWTIAEHAGDATPDGLQHLLAGAVWDEHAVRDDVRDYLVEHLGDPEAVLVVDETGDLKKGASTVGVQRQYTGTAGKVDNAQVAVYLAYATSAGHGVIDRELYLPRGWLADPGRCHAAGVPDQVGFATKSELARMMLERALDAGVPAGWVTADEVYGGSPALRGWLETRRLPYVLAVKCTEPLPMPSGPPTPAARLAGRVPPACWLRISAGLGAKGRRWYGWSRVALSSAGAPEGWERWLLLRRSLTTGELAYYVCAGPAGLPDAGVALGAGLEAAAKLSAGLVAHLDDLEDGNRPIEMDPAAAQAGQLTEPQARSEKGEDVIPPEQWNAAEESASFFGGEGAALGLPEQQVGVGAAFGWRHLAYRVAFPPSWRPILPTAARSKRCCGC